MWRSRRPGNEGSPWSFSRLPGLDYEGPGLETIREGLYRRWSEGLVLKDTSWSVRRTTDRDPEGAGLDRCLGEDSPEVSRV